MATFVCLQCFRLSFEFSVSSCFVYIIDISIDGAFQRFTHRDIDVLCSDFFHLSFTESYSRVWIQDVWKRL